MPDTDLSATPTPATNAAGIKDTLESILIALILAFVFRAFFVEAFVIPTGSMATTLLGAHMRFHCEDCGWEFTSNYSAPQRAGSDDMLIPSRADGAVFSLTCPNCGFHVQRNNGNDPMNDASSPPVYYGDRILVQKYAYLLEKPKRWDVIVFRSPYDQRGNDSAARPASQPEFQQNYIKRLIGLPGEQILLIDGDVYARRADAEPWTVQTKPKTAQDALWRIVSDFDHQPLGINRGSDPVYRSPWSTPTGANAFAVETNGRNFVASESGSAMMRFDPSANPRKNALTDWMTFNSTHEQQIRMSRATTARDGLDEFNANEIPGQHNVSDLQLRLSYQRLGGDGPVDLSMTKFDHHFTARLWPDRVEVIHTKADNSQDVIGTYPLKADGKAVDVSFENVDYCVTLRINGKAVITSTPEQYAPNIERLLQLHRERRFQPPSQITIASRGAGVRLSHLSLWRDIYYLNDQSQSVYKNPPWASPEEPIRLSNTEYFPLGDNSALSLDARYWKAPIVLPDEDLFAEGGRVPERFMLGKAFFVYWPAGYRFTDSSYGVIPNFGKMRLIH